MWVDCISYTWSPLIKLLYFAQSEEIMALHLQANELETRLKEAYQQVSSPHF
jgi:hypothetical protein